MFRAAINSNRSLRAARLGGLVLVGVLLALSSGCSLMETCGCISPAPPPAVNEVTTFWYEQIQYVQDTEHQGQSLPGLAGRVWLHSTDVKNMVEARGFLYAEMYDTTPGAEPRKLADWSFDKDNLKLLKRKDVIGMGYTLFLPWETYRPEIKRVQLRLAYVEPGKAPQFAEPQILALKAAEPAPLIVKTEYEYAPAERRLPVLK